MSSLRLAIKLSLEPSPPASDNDISDIMAKRTKEKQTRRRAAAAIVPVVELPKIDKCIRNKDPTKIDRFGFVEVSRTLSHGLIQEIYQEALDKVKRHDGVIESPSSSPTSASASTPKRKKPSGPSGVEVEEISNALQTDVSDVMLEKITTTIYGSLHVAGTMQTVFGQRGGSDTESNYAGQFVLETPKVLLTKPGSNPQIPHADDHCTSCLVCLVHLCDKQEPTRIAEYEGSNKDYATGITVSCDECDRHEQLPDSAYRRGVHWTDEAWHCTDCKSRHVPYDFESKMATSFGELLERNAPNLCDSYAGKKDVKAGDGLLCLPTLIHRGPGNPTSAKNSRCMLFFTLRPLYTNMKCECGLDKSMHKYNPALQIHAPCILYNQFKKVKSIYESSGCSLDGYLSAFMGSDQATTQRENKQLKEKLKQSKENEASILKENSQLKIQLEQREEKRLGNGEG